ncbi:energy transducer TonB [Luteibacter aegosomatissinici]|uniref:energy transducer TonB n=1 Tax=Luteibacter aegosomatissinici TaxID=2911539 RepID=UPI001FF89798|nr:energy transducer TonB [Luteibacter aegosomatissinici]UPG92555.1 energy transducer TonB [Luteibacter aegosomatissinici]
MRRLSVVCVACVAMTVAAAVVKASDLTIETVLAQASAINGTPAGKQYNAMLYAGTGMDNTKASILLCASLYPQEDMEGMVVSGVVFPGGIMRHARVLPDTPFTQCFMRRFVNQQFPPLPVTMEAFPLALVIDLSTGHASDPFTSFTKKSSRDAVTKASAPLYAPRPVYPKGAMTDRVTGNAMVLIVFGNLGTPVDVRVEKSSGDARLDAAALYAARHWVFRPTLGRQLSVRVPISFDLRHSCADGCAKAWEPVDDQ